MAIPTPLTTGRIINGLPEEYKSVPSSENKKYGHPRFYELLDKMADIHSMKNHDYAGTNDPLYNFKSVRRINVEPWLGIFIRMFDKWSRLENFVKNSTLYVKDENVADTLIDLANYAVLMLILLEEEQASKGKESNDLKMTATEAINQKTPHQLSMKQKTKQKTKQNTEIALADGDLRRIEAQQKTPHRLSKEQ